MGRANPAPAPRPEPEGGAMPSVESAFALGIAFLWNGEDGREVLKMGRGGGGAKVPVRETFDADADADVDACHADPEPEPEPEYAEREHDSDDVVVTGDVKTDAAPDPEGLRLALWTCM